MIAGSAREGVDSSVVDQRCRHTSAERNPIAPLGRTSGPTRRSTKGGWTKEEDKLLAEAVEKYGGRNWKKIAEHLPKRTDVQCLHRWQKVLDPTVIKGPWTEEEDAQIIQLVEKYGCKKWASIAGSLPGRIGKQCRERWYNHLNPAIKKNPWTLEEEGLLIQTHRMYGNKWVEIAKVLPGRSENSIKNHWNSNVMKKLDSNPSSMLLGQQSDISLSMEVGKAEYPNSNVNTSIADEMVQTDRNEFPMISSEVLVHENTYPRRQQNLVLKPIPLQETVCSEIQARTCLQKDSGFPEARGNNFAKNVVHEIHAINSVQACSLSSDEHANCAGTPSQRHNSGYDDASDHSCEAKRSHSVRSCNAVTSDSGTPSQRHNSGYDDASDHSCEAKRSHSVRSCNAVTSDYISGQNLLPLDQSHHSHELPTREPGGIFRKNCVTCANGMLESQVNSSALQDYEFDVNKYNKTPFTPINIINRSSDSSGQQNFLQEGSSTVQEPSPSQCSTSPNFSSGIILNVKNTDSILREAAKSFKDTPSIIRKRRNDCLRSSEAASSRQTVVDTEDSASVCCGSVDTTLRLGCCWTENFDSRSVKSKDENLKATVPFHVLQEDSLESQNLPSKRYIGKRLEREFDKEWAAANFVPATILGCHSPSANFVSVKRQRVLD